MKLTLELGTADDLAWAQQVVSERHYLRAKVHRWARPMVYPLRLFGERVGLVMAGIPHATRTRGWWGYPDLPTQWQVVDLNRIWLDPRLQKGGEWCSPELLPGFIGWRGRWWPSVTSWAIGEVLVRVQRDRVSMWPPVYLHQPYHVLLAISYHDPQFHKGSIYQHAGAEPMYTDADGRPRPAASGKYGWCWRLPEPSWTWQEIEIRQPRTLRLF